MYPSHVVAARKVICADVTSLAVKWFTPNMWEHDDPIELQDLTLAMNMYAKACIRLAVTLKLAKISQLVIKKMDAFIQSYHNEIKENYHKNKLLYTKKCLVLLEVANIWQCDVVAMIHDNSEWQHLYTTTRKMLEKFFYPNFPTVEDEGLDLYLQMIKC